MATIHVGGIHPFAKTVKSIEDAINMAMDDDTIVLHKKRIVMAHGADVQKSLYIEGNNCVISIPDRQVGFQLSKGNFHLSNVNFTLGMQNNAINILDTHFGKIYLDNVQFHHAKVRLREEFPSLQCSAPAKGGSGTSIYMNNCNCDYSSINCKYLEISNSEIGRLYRPESSLLANNLVIKGQLTTSNTYVSCGNTANITSLVTAGQLRLNGKYDISQITVTYSGIDNGGKYISGSKVRKLLQEWSENGNQNTDNYLFTVFGGKNYLSELTIHQIKLEQPDEKFKSYYKRGWFNLSATSLSLDGSSEIHLPQLDFPSIVSGGTISMSNIDDGSDWQISEKTTLSNKGSKSSLFEEGSSDVKANNDSNVDPTKRNFGALAELNAMIGLANVKKQVQADISQAVMQKTLRERGVQANNVASLHMVFAGNPGTGKTHVARLVAKLLYENGVLKTNKCVEKQSGDLVAGYVGQTAQKTRKVVESALDGVLFIDEAYTLTHQQGNSFNDEAVAELLKDMDDHRDRLVVIVAGYTDKMRDFFRLSNPGLQSRFANWIDFPDYTPREMLQIAQYDLNKANLQLANADTAIALKNSILNELGSLNKNAGNGRFIRNCIEKIQSAQNMRITGLGATAMQNMSTQEMMTITKADVIQGMNAVRTQEQNMTGLQGMS